MTRYDRLIATLCKSEVEFILIGGAAATVHGSARLTQDLDILYSREKPNLERLVRALEPHAPYLRGAPAGLPFRWDVSTIIRGLNFTLITDLGAIDLLGRWLVWAHTTRCCRLGLNQLLQAKRAAGRPKDLEVIAELEQLRDEQSG